MKLKVGQRYWYINFDDFFVERGHNYDWWPEALEERLRNNNIFPTKSKAQSALKKIKKVLKETKHWD